MASPNPVPFQGVSAVLEPETWSSCVTHPPPSLPMCELLQLPKGLVDTCVPAAVLVPVADF